MRFSKVYLLVFIFFLCSGELFSRYYLGLGSPLLYMEDVGVEYILKPNQNVERFGNKLITNSYSMRSTDFDAKKKSDEFRIIAFGDSVLNGGSWTDHEDLATTLLKRELVKLVGKNVNIGNVSAGSWGPGNWLAYAEKYGFFGADILFLIISSHDAYDNPTFSSLSSNTHPQTTPYSAMLEGFTRYLPRYIPSFNGGGQYS